MLSSKGEMANGLISKKLLLKQVLKIIFIFLIQNSCIKRILQGLPWWRSGLQCRRHGFEPWSGKIPHAAEQLSPGATTTEPARQSPQATTIEPTRLEPVLRN